MKSSQNARRDFPIGYKIRRRWWRRLFSHGVNHSSFPQADIVQDLPLHLRCLDLLDLFRYFALPIQSPPKTESQPSGSETLYIASTHWNNEYVLRNHWNDQIVRIAEYFGPQNVFVSVYESGSWDNSKGALSELDLNLNNLGVAHKIVLDPTTHQDEISKSPAEFGWVQTPRGKKELRRIPYLSGLRNLSLEPLLNLYHNGTRFDKVLFLNDVIFSVADVTTLLSTNDGEYAAACSLDFSKKAPAFYDTFALRDSEGHEAVMSTWQYFRSSASRNALRARRPVPVRSCWNGIVAMDPKPFYDNYRPLRFRGVPDSLAEFHLEGSECCLIHQDNPLTAKHGVWLNPDVRVAYQKEAYDSMKDGDAPCSVFAYMRSVWENRLRRWCTSDYFKRYVVRSRISRWQKAGGNNARSETGIDCLINEMQVLIHNGWKHL
jgi:Cryptococcal mannosyltransferase 1